MRSKIRFLAGLFIGLCVVVFLFFYFFHQSKAFLTGPQIVVDTPENGETLSTAFVFIKGNAINSDTLLLNGRAIITDSSGGFEEGLLLARGYNIIGLMARDKFGRETEKKIEVVFE